MAAGATLAIITSQGRGVIIAAVIILLAFGWLTATSRNRVTSLVGFALAALVAAFVASAVLGSAAAVRYHGLGPSSIVQTTNQARGRSIARIPHNLVTYPFGAGLATAGPASGSAPGASQLTLSGTVDTETEFSFLTVETGIPGMLAVVGFTIALLMLGVRRLRQEPDREARVLLGALLAPIVGLLALYFTSALTPTVPGGPYLWAVGGIVSYWLVVRPAERRRAQDARKNASQANGWTLPAGKNVNPASVSTSISPG
jgi:multisubunit Na+/H+ antiporter MnhB subunit